MNIRICGSHTAFVVPKGPSSTSRGAPAGPTTSLEAAHPLGPASAIQVDPAPHNLAPNDLAPRDLLPKDLPVELERALDEKL